MKALQEHLASITGANGDFEIVFNAAGAENINRAKVSHKVVR
ncbi:hypothetical protein MNBD_GAMMA18-2492 [hydrothermal vent metagenome]|uniref:Uncharacterized protein n=1 Tax=hydrothermal vent metagenome TaxID=652676 RepID=A0A3B0ZQ29_9ZZZZ